MNNKNRDIIDEALKLRYLHGVEESDFETELNAILATKFDANLSASLKSELLQKLVDYANEETFGSLLKNQDSKQVLSISQEIGLSEDFVSQLYADKVLINRIPILRLKRLLESLTISFEDAKTAVLRTAKLLSHQVELSRLSSNQVAYRKTGGRNEYVSWGGDFKSDLFDNQEALSKYLDKLDELMTR